MLVVRNYDYYYAADFKNRAVSEQQLYIVELWRVFVHAPNRVRAITLRCNRSLIRLVPHWCCLFFAVLFFSFRQYVCASSMLMQNRKLVIAYYTSMMQSLISYPSRREDILCEAKLANGNSTYLTEGSSAANIQWRCCVCLREASLRRHECMHDACIYLHSSLFHACPDSSDKFLTSARGLLQVLSRNMCVRVCVSSGAVTREDPFHILIFLRRISPFELSFFFFAASPHSLSPGLQPVRHYRLLLTDFTRR